MWENFMYGVQLGLALLGFLVILVPFSVFSIIILNIFNKDK